MANFTAGPIPRADLPVENRLVTDESGDLTTDWIDTAGYRDGRVSLSVHGGDVPSVFVEQAQWIAESGDPYVLLTEAVGVSSYSGYLEFPLALRYFRVTLAGASSSTVVDLTVRMV